MFGDLIARLSELTTQRDQANIEIAKLKQLIVATFAMMPEERQAVFQKEVDELQAESAGLSEAIRLVFSAHKGEPLTPARVRDYLADSGFDFRQYTANPLASIATTLKRMTPDYLTVGVSNSGQATYTRRLTLLDQMGREGYEAARKAMAPNTPFGRFKQAHDAKLSREAKAIAAIAEAQRKGKK